MAPPHTATADFSHPFGIPSHFCDTRIRASARLQSYRTSLMSRQDHIHQQCLDRVNTSTNQHPTGSLGFQTDISAEGVRDPVINSHIISSHMQLCSFFNFHASDALTPLITASSSAILIWEEESSDRSQLASSTT